MLLESQGYDVKSTIIQALCRDSGLRIATERYITQPIYLIPINRISDHWLSRYLQAKTKRLQQALETGIVQVYVPLRKIGMVVNVMAIVSSQSSAKPFNNINFNPNHL